MIVPLNVMRWGDPGAEKVAVALHGITANGGPRAGGCRHQADGHHPSTKDMVLATSGSGGGGRDCATTGTAC